MCNINRSKISSSLDSYRSGGTLLLFSLLILIFIILDQLKILSYQFSKWIIQQLPHTLKAFLSILQKQDKYGISKRYIRLNTNPDGRFTRAMTNFGYFSIWVLYLFLLSTFLAKFTIDTQSAQISPEWGFGQIVAITVWAAPLFEYLKLVIRKCPSMCHLIEMPMLTLL